MAAQTGVDVDLDRLFPLADELPWQKRWEAFRAKKVAFLADMRGRLNRAGLLTHSTVQGSLFWATNRRGALILGCLAVEDFLRPNQWLPNAPLIPLISLNPKHVPLPRDVWVKLLGQKFLDWGKDVRSGDFPMMSRRQFRIMPDEFGRFAVILAAGIVGKRRPRVFNVKGYSTPRANRLSALWFRYMEDVRVEMA